MSSMTPQIKGESIQSLYRLYSSDKLLANRRYQRKLVWTMEEKQSFIDSIIKGFPIPIILLAEVGTTGNVKYEIIDGMQRLNAIMSFVEQEYPINRSYFDLNTIAETKDKLDSGIIKQNESILDRTVCVQLAGYQVPVSIYTEREEKNIDEVFRRLNSNGRHLSRQELRQAGATGSFANVVRRLSSNIRGDSSTSDILPLSKMKSISINNKNLTYGIDADSVFWIKEKILKREDLRESKDEEIIADIVAWVTSDKAQRSSSDILDGYYGFTNSQELSQQIDRSINKVGHDIIISNIQTCFDCLLEIIGKSGGDLRNLIFSDPQPRFPRFFQLYFLALYEMLFEHESEIENIKNLIAALRHSGDGIKLAEGGGNWSASEKERGIAQIVGIISASFKKNNSIDPSRKYFISRFENILSNSTTEQTLYDFKVGFYDIKLKSSFNTSLFNKTIKTLTAMANTHKGAIGYIVVGVCDKKTTADSHKRRYTADYEKFCSYFITGIDAEANAYEKDTDFYFTKITNLIKNQPISDRDKDYIGRNIFTVSYYGKTIIIMSLCASDEPSIYNDEYFTRFGSNVEPVKAKQMLEFMKRFTL
jgi:hypothetical protein